MDSFTKKSKEWPKYAGWRKGRHVDPMPYVECLRQDGYTIHPCVVTFLSEFGGLIIHYVNQFGNNDELHFDVNSGDFIPENVLVYSDRVKKVLCPIGGADDYMSTIMMDSDAHVYYGTPSWLFYCGQNSYEGIEAIISGEGLKKIELIRMSDS